jgi:hypothetical protein
MRAGRLIVIDFKRLSSLIVDSCTTIASMSEYGLCFETTEVARVRLACHETCVPTIARPARQHEMTQTRMMRRIMNTQALSLAVVVLALSGCSISQTIDPIKTPISRVCVHENPKVLMDEFQPEMEKQIQEKGFQTESYKDEQPNDCSHRLEYTANWAWDMAMYLTYADIQVFDRTGLAGRAVYDARSGSGRLDKFGRTAEKMKPLIDELFGSAPQGPIAVQPTTWEQAVDSHGDSAARLRELESLKEQGLVTEEEFARKRQKILDQI